MKKIRKSLAIFSLLIGMFALSINAYAEEIGTDEYSESGSGYYVSPFYQNEYTEDDLAEIIDVPQIPTDSDELVGGPSFGSFNEAAAYLKTQLANRATSVDFTVGFFVASPKEIYQAAIAENDSTPIYEGDYLQANVYGTSFAWAGNYFTYKFVYMDNATENDAVQAAIPGIIKKMGVSAADSEYDRVKAINDYLCENIVYFTNGALHYHSTYSALIEGKTVCQGYASSFHVLAKTLGLKSRYITGYAGGAHAWNIVKIDGAWYNIDVTWDDGEYQTNYDYFLMCNTHFKNHRRDSNFNGAFNTSYPMGTACFPSCDRVIAKEHKNLNIANPISNGYVLTNEETFSPVANGKAKVLVFYDINKDDSIATLQSIVNNSWKKKELYDICAIDANAASNANTELSMINNLISNKLGGGGNVLFTYSPTSAGKADAKILSSAVKRSSAYDLPIVAVIDANNILQYYSEGKTSESTIASALRKYIDGYVNKSVLAFSDVKEDKWYSDPIEYVYLNGIMNGYNGKGMFGVSDSLTREQFATILYRLAGSPPSTYTGRFSDVKPGKYYTEAIEWCAANSIVNGYAGKNRFGVGNEIERQQLAAMLYRFASYKGDDVSERADISAYPDLSKLEPYAAEAMQWCVGKGIVTGANRNGIYYLNPKNKATRAECATMIARFLNGDI